MKTAHSFEQVEKQLNQLESAVRDKAMLAGLRDMAKPLKQDLKSTLPHNSGALKQSIGYKTLSKRRRQTLGLQGEDAVEVSAIRRVLDHSGKKRYQLYKLRFLNYGTQAHVVRPKKQGGKLKLPNGQYVKEAIAGGVRARHYLKQVYQKHQSHLQGLFVKGVQRLLAKHGVTLYG